jgi:hypothetical protein
MRKAEAEGISVNLIGEINIGGKTGESVHIKK